MFYHYIAKIWSLFDYYVNLIISACHLGGYIGPEAPEEPESIEEQRKRHGWGAPDNPLDPRHQPLIPPTDPFPVGPYDLITHRPGFKPKLPEVEIHHQEAAAEIPLDTGVPAAVEDIKEALEEATEEVFEEIVLIVKEVINIVVPIFIEWWHWLFPPIVLVIREFINFVVEVISSIATSDRFILYTYTLNLIWLYLVAFLNTVINSRIFEFFVHLIDYTVHYGDYFVVPHYFYAFFSILVILRSWAITLLLVVINFIIFDTTIQIADTLVDFFGTAVFFLTQFVCFFGEPWYLFKFITILHYLHVFADTLLFVIINLIISDVIGGILADIFENLCSFVYSSGMFNFLICFAQIVQSTYLTAFVLLILFAELLLPYILKFGLILLIILLQLLYYFIWIFIRNTPNPWQLLILRISIIYQLLRVLISELPINWSKIYHVFYLFLFVCSSYFIFFISTNFMFYCLAFFFITFNPYNTLASLILLKFFFIATFFFYYNFFTIVFNLHNYFLTNLWAALVYFTRFFIFIFITIPYSLISYFYKILLKLFNLPLSRYFILLFESTIRRLANFIVFIVLDCRGKLLIFLNLILYLAKFFSTNRLLFVTTFAFITNLLTRTNFLNYLGFIGSLFLIILVWLVYIFSYVIIRWYRLGILNNEINFIIAKLINFFSLRWVSARTLEYIFFLIFCVRLYVWQQLYLFSPQIAGVVLFILYRRVLARIIKETVIFLINNTSYLKQHLSYRLLYTKKYLNNYKFILINFLNYIAQIIVQNFKDKSWAMLLSLAKFFFNIKRYFTDHLFTKCAFLKYYIYEWYVINLYYAPWSIKNFRKLAVKLVVDNVYNMYGRFIRYLNFRHQYFLQNSKRYFLIIHWWRNISLKQAHTYSLFTAYIINSKLGKIIKNMHNFILSPKTDKSKNSWFYKIFGNNDKKKK